MRPHEDARMVAVAAHQVLELREPFGAGGHHAGFVEHQHAQLVGGVEQLRGGRIVRGAQRVAAHFLQRAHAVILHRIGHRRAHAGVVLMVAGALQFDGLAVEQEALVRIKHAGADAEGRLIAIRNGAAGFHLGHQLVQVALFQRPQRRRLHHHLLFSRHARRAPRWRRRAQAALPTALPAGSRMVEVTRASCAALAEVLHLGANLDGGFARAALRCARTCPTFSRAAGWSSPARRAGRCPRPRRTSRRSRWRPRAPSTRFCRRAWRKPVTSKRNGS